MANIKNLQMGSAICADSRIGISKSWLGLHTTVTYLPTNSVVDARVIGFSPQDGDCLRRLLTSPLIDLSKTVESFHPQPVENGNYLLEVCASRDGRFVALLLLHYVLLGYEPVTDVCFYEDKEAYLIGKLFKNNEP